MTSPATAKQRIAGKKNVDDFVCIWLVGIESDRACFPQIDYTIASVRHSVDELEVLAKPPFPKNCWHTNHLPTSRSFANAASLSVSVNPSTPQASEFG